MNNGTASSTARLIARSILLASRETSRRKLIAPKDTEMANAILQESGGNKIFRLALSYFPKKILLYIERKLLPGIITHYLVRKRKIERTVRESIIAGNKTVVVIAAGFDTLCLRLQSEFPDTVFIEVDHPATQRPKQSAFPLSQNLHFIALDLTKESIDHALRCSSYIKEEMWATFVIEGLTMYLTETTVQNLFRQIAPYCKNVIFTFMEKDENGEIGFREQSPLVDSWLKARNEPFLWGITKAELPFFLAKLGLELIEIVGEKELRNEFLIPHDLGNLALARGECICFAAPIS
jgi:methyltransferase (TIGR00027 family)